VGPLIKCQSFSKNTVLAFPFLLDNKANDEVCTRYATAARKSPTFSEQDSKSRPVRRVAPSIFERGALRVGPATGAMRLHLNLMEIGLPTDGI